MPSALSKVFNTEFGCVPCHLIAHPGMTCPKSVATDFLYFLQSNAKFFFPVTVIPLLMKIKRINPDMVKDSLRYFVEATLTGYAIGNTVASLICFFRHFRGKFHMNTFLTAPCFIAGFWIFFTTPRVAQLFSSAIFQVSIEAYVRKQTNVLTRTIATSKLAQMLIFMTCSATILHVMQNYKITPFWFVRPSQRLEVDKPHSEGEERNKKCIHEGKCVHHCWSGIKSHFVIGIALDVLKTITTKPPKHTGGFVRGLIEKFRKMQFGSVNFLVAYMSIYRISNCLLNNYWTNGNSDKSHTIAAFLGGASYMFYPKMTVLAYAVSVCVQMLWRLFKKYEGKSELVSKSEIVEKIRQLPLDRMFVPFGVAYIVNVYMFKNSVMNSLGAGLINGVTNNKAFKIWTVLKPQMALLRV